MSLSKREIIRRLRLGNLRRLLRARCGHILPDDDAGREYLWELLLTVSLGPGERRKMDNVISIAAPWMSPDEANGITDQIKCLPNYRRTSKPREIGERLRVTREEWIRLNLKTILPIDMTDAEIAEFRKANDRARQRRNREKAGAKSREAWLTANALIKSRPWEAEGVSRRTWFRNRAKGRDTGPSAIKLTYRKDALVPLECVDRPEGAGHGSRRAENKKKRASKNKKESTRRCLLARPRAERTDLCQPSRTMVCNGFAISGNGQNPEDRNEPDSGQVLARVWLQEILRPPDGKVEAA